MIRGEGKAFVKVEAKVCLFVCWSAFVKDSVNVVPFISLVE